jgi:hypothetical protein
MTDTASTTPATEVWRRPATLDELRAALDAFSGWDAIERARRAPELIEATKAVLADERAAAMGEAKTGMGVTALARELRITRQKVYDALARATSGRAAVDDNVTAAAGVSAYRLRYDGADHTWLLLAGDQVLADHDGLTDDPADAEAVCSWATGVLVDEGAGPVDWRQRSSGDTEYVPRA